MQRRDRKFSNPLLQPTDTETTTEAQTQMPAHTEAKTEVPAAVETSTSTSTEMQTSTSANTFAENPFDGRQYGPNAYDRTHMRVTFWMDRAQVKRLDALKKKKRRAKAALLYEAMDDLFKKYEEGRLS